MMEKPQTQREHHHQEAEGQHQQQVVVVVHSQVRRIKQEEDEKVKVHETFQHHQASEMRLVLRDIARQRSRSPLGRAARPAISIGAGDY
ncbi:hypothetical protein U9M48_022047 [Paspalum notatum var. saurae]|uniref:Uncharacterized protein n=1 Tax=Paspalum notatum var. saurae TaxID=547442 RepID=A0AAQ3TIW3_PASNO